MYDHNFSCTNLGDLFQKHKLLHNGSIFTLIFYPKSMLRQTNFKLLHGNIGNNKISVALVTLKPKFFTLDHFFCMMYNPKVLQTDSQISNYRKAARLRNLPMLKQNFSNEKKL